MDRLKSKLDTVVEINSNSKGKSEDSNWNFFELIKHARGNIEWLADMENRLSC